MDITRLLAAVNGESRGVDLTTNTPVVLSIKIGGVTNTELTKTILDNLVNLQNGTDFSTGTNSHTHDGRYYTHAELNSATGGSSGSMLIGDDNSYSNFTPTAATVKGALAGIDAALTGTGGIQLDGTFKIENTSDPTKIMMFDVSGVSTGQTRTLKMADANVDLANLTNSNISATAAIALTKLAALTNHNRALVSDNSGFIAESAVTSTELGYVSGVTSAIQTQINGKLSLTGGTMSGNIAMGGNKLTGLGAGTTAGDSVRYEQAILASGVNPWTGNQDLGGFKITGSGAPTNPGDLTDKAYVDNLVQGLNWKETVRSATTAALAGTYVYNNGTSGVGATITQNGTISGNALTPQDGVTLVVNDRLLVKNEVSGNIAYNGIYVVTQVGDGATVPYILTRATDADTAMKLMWATVEVGPDASTQAGYIFRESDDITTIGTDPVAFSIISHGLDWVFSDGLTVTGNTVKVLANPTNASITVASAGISAKLDGARAITSGASGLGVNVDNATIDISGNAIEVKTGGITNTQVSASAAIAYSKLNLSNSIVNADIATGAAIAYSKLNLTNSIVLGDLTSNSVDENKIVSTTFSGSGAITGGSGTKVAWVPDGSSLEISSNAGRIKTTAYDQSTITGGGGSAAAVQFAPAVKAVFVAGQTFAANTSYAVRFGLTANGETAGRIYAADPDTSSFDLFYVIGMISGGAGFTAGQNVTVTRLGAFSLSSSDSAFGSGTDGAPVFLTSAGALTTTAPSSAGSAVTRVGMVKVRSATPASNVVDVSPQTILVN